MNCWSPITEHTFGFTTRSKDSNKNQTAISVNVLHHAAICMAGNLSLDLYSNKRSCLYSYSKWTCLFYLYCQLQRWTFPIMKKADLRWPIPLRRISVPQQIFGSNMSHFNGTSLSFQMIPKTLGVPKSDFLLSQF